MYQTQYHRAASADEAVSLVNGADDGRFLAGGQTLLPTMKQRLAAPSDVVDIRHVDGLGGIEVTGTAVRIGATTTHAAVAADAALAAVCPVLGKLAGRIGDPHVRHMGTIGGSVANNDPAADYPAAVLGLDGTVVTNRRSIAAADFFTGMFETCLEDDELIVAVEFKVPTNATYVKFPNPASRYAMTGVLVARMADGSVRVAVTGAGAGGVYRSADLEQRLDADFSTAAIAEAVVDPADMLSDMHASAEYRAHLVRAMTERAVTALI